MVLFDFDFFRMGFHMMLLANLLTATSLLIAKMWKLEAVPSLEGWTTKIGYIYLISKLSALSKFREGVGQ